MFLANDWQACLRIPLPVPFPTMEHEPESDSKDKVECPGNKAPVEKGEHPCPLRKASAHLSDVGIGGIHDPLGKAIK